MTIAGDVAHKLGWIKRSDGFWAYSDVDRTRGVGFMWDSNAFYAQPFQPDVRPEHTVYVKRDIESRRLYWTCVSPRRHGDHFSFTITSLKSSICVNAKAETEEIACCLAFLEIPETSIPETKGENDDE